MPDRLIGQMHLRGRDVFLFDSDFFETTDCDQAFAHAVLHALDERGHRRQGLRPRE
jgi:hypothetical protein